MLKQWYIVHTYSGYEDKVKSNIELLIKKHNVDDLISRIIIPTENIVIIRQNKKKVKQRKFYPSYIFIEMIITDVSYWFIKNIVGVTGFLGGIKPIPMGEEEVFNLLNVAEHSTSKPRPAILFEREEGVRITDGPFKHFVGVVDEINQEKGKIKVMVTIFGRPTSVELDFLQVEKM
jgi:transcriptional antiterminator NusG